MTPEGRAVLDKLRVSQGLDPSLPWGGRSPRELTRVALGVNLKPLGDDATDFSPEEDARIEEQYRRFNHGS